MHELPFRGFSPKVRLAVGVWSLTLAVSQAASAAPAVIAVDCAAGGSVRAALVTARTTFQPVEIVVKGVCKERIVIDRDEVTLRGADATAGLDGSGLAGTEPLVTVNDAHRVVLDTLRLTPTGKTGLRLESGAAVRASGLEIEGADFGVALFPQTTLQLSGSSVFKSAQTGIYGRGAALIVNNCRVYDSGANGITLSGGLLDMFGSASEKNSFHGVSVLDNAVAIIGFSSIDDNAVGVFVRLGGRATLGTGSAVTGNRLEGVRVWDASTLFLGGGAVIEGNGRAGVSAMGASEVSPQQTTIKNNHGDGITVLDTSLVTSPPGASPLITGNSGWGIACESFPGDARLGSPGFGAAAVFGNTAGQLSCPGYFVR